MSPIYDFQHPKFFWHNETQEAHIITKYYVPITNRGPQGARQIFEFLDSAEFAEEYWEKVVYLDIFCVVHIVRR